MSYSNLLLINDPLIFSPMSPALLNGHLFNLALALVILVVIEGFLFAFAVLVEGLGDEEAEAGETGQVDGH